MWNIWHTITIISLQRELRSYAFAIWPGLQCLFGDFLKQAMMKNPMWWLLCFFFFHLPCWKHLMLLIAPSIGNPMVIVAANQWLCSWLLSLFCVKCGNACLFDHLTHYFSCVEDSVFTLAYILDVCFIVCLCGWAILQIPKWVDISFEGMWHCHERGISMKVFLLRA